MPLPYSYLRKSNCDSISLNTVRKGFHVNDTIKKYLLQSTMIAGLATAGFAVPAYAQDADEDLAPISVNDTSEEVADNEDLVVVTGSRIRRTVGDAPIPLTVIDQAQADISGFNNLADFLSDIPALQGSQVPDDTTGAVLNAAGLNLLNLRNLGANRTLVLIDGLRQVASQSGSAAVDIGTIPFIAIQQTEVVTGGASSLYGADAVSGVVNFVTTRDFEGIELDAQFAEDENGFNDSYRLSALVGDNFANDKGNAFLAIEYRDTAELLNSQVDFLERNRFFARLDNDDVVEGQLLREADGIPNFGLFENGTLDIINNAGVLNVFGTSGVNPNDTRITFTPDGQAIPFNLGEDPRVGGDLEGTSNTLINGDGTTLNGLSQSLTPSNDTINLLGRVNYEVFNDVNYYLEGRYSRSRSISTFQPNFFGGGTPNAIGTAGENRVLNPGIFGRSFFTATDNAFLDPGAAAAIEGNFGLADVQRFQSEFNRSQDATRQLFRIVTGLEGEFTSFFDESSNWLWDVNFNFGRTETVNRQLNTRLNDNFFAGADAIQITGDDIALIADAGGDTSRFAVGDIACRVQLLDELGESTSLQAIGAISQQTIDDCVPFSVFGEGAISPEGLDFISADLNDVFRQEQLQITANVTGDLVDLWGAGPALFAAGFEYRDEFSLTAPDELPLNANTFANVIQPTVGSFDVYEVYGELELPILTDKPFVNRLSATGSFRYSDYSTIGSTETFSVRGEYEPFDDLAIRGGYALAIRAPNIGELFLAPSQTFANIGDPCDIINIDQGPATRAANCAAIGVPVGFDRTATNPDGRNISVPGSNAGNPNLEPEESDSFFAGLTYTPDFLPGFVVALDYYNIEIDNAVAALGINAILSNCVDGAAPDLNFCNLITRAPDGNVIDFLSAPVNIGSFGNEGIDFQAVYRKDLGDLFSTSENLGSLTLATQGTRLLSSTSQSDPADDTTFAEARNFVGLPELRFNFDATYTYEDFSITYGLNWQNSQDVFDRRNNLFDAVNNPQGNQLDDLADIPSEFLSTGSFAEHDIAVRYTIADQVTLRGGVVNIFDNEPPGFAENNIFDFFGRRFFLGANVSF